MNWDSEREDSGGREGDEMKNSGQMGRDGRRKRGGRGRRPKKNRNIGVTPVGWRSGERARGIWRIQRSDGVGGRQPGFRALRQASLVGRQGPEGKGVTLDPFSHSFKNSSRDSV